MMLLDKNYKKYVNKCLKKDYFKTWEKTNNTLKLNKKNRKPKNYNIKPINQEEKIWCLILEILKWINGNYWQSKKRLKQWNKWIFLLLRFAFELKSFNEYLDITYYFKVLLS